MRWRSALYFNSHQPPNRLNQLGSHLSNADGLAEMQLGAPDAAPEAAAQPAAQGYRHRPGTAGATAALVTPTLPKDLLQRIMRALLANWEVRLSCASARTWQ